MHSMPALALVFAAVLVCGCVGRAESGLPYSVDDQGRMALSSARPAVEFNETVNATEVSGAILKRIEFQGYLGRVAGLLWLPANATGRVPAMLYFPGAQVGKEAGTGFSRILVPEGIAVFSLDQPGVGGTGYAFNATETDFAAFSEGRIATVHSYVLDGVRALDLLASRPEIDAGAVFTAGESMGGRTALIVAAIDSRARGALAVSSAGYGRPSGLNANWTRFLRSFDPDNYMLLLPPRPAHFIHSPADSVVPLDSARQTFNLGGKPKTFAEIACPNHGYCELMDGEIAAASRAILSGR